MSLVRAATCPGSLRHFSTPFTQPNFPRERIKVATLDARTSSVFDHRHLSGPGFDFGSTGRRLG